VPRSSGGREQVAQTIFYLCDKCKNDKIEKKKKKPQEMREYIEIRKIICLSGQFLEVYKVHRESMIYVPKEEKLSDQEKFTNSFIPNSSKNYIDYCFVL
jgi:hypothetical protein